MCEWFDETIGDLLAKLDKNGQAENTIVVYLHDNGWIQDPESPNYAPKPMKRGIWQRCSTIQRRLPIYLNTPHRWKLMRISGS